MITSTPNRLVLDRVPLNMTEDLLTASACYATEYNLMRKLWKLTGGNGNPDAFRHFADPTTRRIMVPIIEQSREKNSQAIEHITIALTKK